VRWRARELWHLMRTEVFIVAVVGCVFLAGTLAVQVAVVAVAGRIGFESAAVSLSCGRGPPALLRSYVAGVFAAAAAAMTFMGLPWGLPVSAGLMMALFAAPALGMTASAPLARMVMFPALPLLALAFAVRDRELHVSLLVAFTMTELFDGFAVLGGKLFGRHRIFPRLSPRKTLEGLLTGVAALAIAALLLPAATLPSPELRLLAPVVIAASAISGDLLASSAKRAAGVKDYLTIMREQGGILDILDAWLVSGPAFAAAWALMAVMG